jgi:hypothetical protein
MSSPVPEWGEYGIVHVTPSEGPWIPCEVCGAAPGRPCRHAVRATRERLRVPPDVEISGLGLVEPAVCTLFRRGGRFLGRLERPAKPLPGRRLWTLYGPEGQWRADGATDAAIDVGRIF